MTIPTVGLEAAEITETARARLRRAVEGLSAIERRATTGGERRSAEWVAGQLRDAGGREVRLTSYRGHSTWAWSVGAHCALALAASTRAGPASRAVALATLASLEADSSGRSLRLRSLLPGRRRGVNVEARLPSSGARRRTVVLVAPHGAAKGGIVGHSGMLGGGRARAGRTGMTPPYSVLPMAAMLALGVAPRGARSAARAVLAAGI